MSLNLSFHCFRRRPKANELTTCDARPVNPVLILGAGYTGSAVARLAHLRGHRVLATVRRPEDVERVRAVGAEPLLWPQIEESALRQQLRHDVTHVVITFPPDGSTDQRIAPALERAGAITYVSSTGVYAELSGTIDDQTPVPDPTPRTAPRLSAEALYRSLGATVLRCPGIYGPDRGLHVRLLNGRYRLPEDATKIVSRIHVHDLARFILAAAAFRGETFVVGDLEPATHERVVRWLSSVYGLALPDASSEEQVHHTLRANRAIDGTRARLALGVALDYPSFREGMAPAARHTE